VGEIADISRTFEEVRTSLGKLDILVNNAATNPYFGHVLDTDLASFQKTVDVNLRGYFFTSVEAGKLMRDAGGGAIVNTASINAIQPGRQQAIYSITKAAVVSMTKAFAKECGVYGIRCNAVLPGLTRTKFPSALIDNDDIREAILAGPALKRYAAPHDLAGAALYLASDARSYTTGESPACDAGRPS